MGLDLTLTEKQKMLRNSALDFMRREAPKEVVQELLETDTGYLEELFRKVADMGWLSIIIPEEYDGAEESLTTAAVLFEVLGSGPLPGAYFSSAILGSQIVMETGNPEQKKEILPAVADGEMILTLALTEPEYSWAPRGVNTTATSKNGDYILDGQKLFILDAQTATHFIVAARTGNEEDPAQGISLFLVDSQSEGVSVRRVSGFLTGRSFEVNFDSVKVPQTAMLGELNQGWTPLQRAIDRSIPVLCAYKVGGSQFVSDTTLEYSRVRIQFGLPIGRFQRIQDMIIEQIGHVDAARWTTYECLWRLDVGRPATENIHLAKAVTSEGYWQACTLAHQVISGISYSKEHPVSFHTRASRSLYNFLGEPAYHRQKIGEILVP